MKNFFVDELHEFVDIVFAQLSYLDNVETSIVTKYNNLIDKIREMNRFSELDFFENLKILNDESGNLFDALSKYPEDETLKELINKTSNISITTKEELFEALTKNPKLLYDFESVNSYGWEDSKFYVEFLETPGSSTFKNVLDSFEDLAIVKKQLQILYNTSIFNLASSFESLIRRVFLAHAKTFPNSLSNHKIEFQFNQIQNFSHIDQLTDFYIENNLSKIMYADCESWLKQLESKMNIKLEKSTIDNLIEFFLVRNLLVHNKGVVNDVYRSKSIIKRFSTSENVKIDYNYIKESIGLLLLAVFEITFPIWNCDNMNETKQKFVFYEESICYSLIQKSNCEIAYQLLKYIYSYREEFDNSDKLILDINHILCLKNVEDESYKKLLESFDSSVLKNVHYMCYYALKDDVSRTLEYFDKCIEDDEYNANQLLSFAVLKEIKDTDQFKQTFETKYANENFKRRLIIFEQ